MKRKLLAFAALAVVLSLTAVACGGDKNDKPADTTAPDAATSAPAEDTSAPAEDDTTAPADETTAPADETTVPAEDETTAPKEEITTPKEEETTTPIVVAPGDYSMPFISDAASNEEGIDLQESDLFMAFLFNYGLGDPHSIVDGKYTIAGINEMIADVDGFYAYSIVMDGVNCRPGALSYAFCRGVQDVAFTGLGEDQITDSVRPIGNFYEDDGDGMLGGSGIYATITEGKLQIVVKYFDATAAKGVRNKYYTLNVDSNKLTFADDGNTVYILAGDTLCATIELSGSKDYDAISTIPVTSFAETAKITLANGLVDTIENTLITDTHTTQVGIASRVGTTQFSSISIIGISNIEIPEMVIDTLQVEQKNFLAGQPINVIANGTATDYVGIYAEDGTLLNKVYLGGDRQVNLNTEATLAAGTYVIRFMPNDATDVSAATETVTIKVVAATNMIYNIGNAGSMVSNNCFDATSCDADDYQTNLKADSIKVPAGATELKLWGWAGFKCESYAFGYIIDDNDPVIKSEFTHVFTDDEQFDKNAIAGAAASAGGIASGRHDIRVDLTGLTAGTYTIRAVAQQEDGAMTVLQQFTITIE